MVNKYVQTGKAATHKLYRRFQQTRLFHHYIYLAQHHSGWGKFVWARQRSCYSQSLQCCLANLPKLFRLEIADANGKNWL